MREAVTELWAVLGKDGRVMHSRGGSSTTPRLMVYTSEKRALQAVRNHWTKQVMQEENVSIECIYRVGKYGCADNDIISLTDEELLEAGISQGYKRIVATRVIAAIRKKLCLNIV